MKKLLVLVVTFVSCLVPLFSQVTLNETKVSADNYEKLAKCCKPEELVDFASSQIRSGEEIFSLENDFELIASLGKNTGAYRFLCASFKRQRDQNVVSTEIDVASELLKYQNLFYRTLEEVNSLSLEKYREQKDYVLYVFSNEVDSTEQKIFEESSKSGAFKMAVSETYESVPIYSLNEIVADFKDNEIAARSKWFGKQVKLTATIYSVYQLDYNTVFSIDSKEKNVVPVIRINSGSQIFANCFFNNEDVSKLAKCRKNKQVTLVGYVNQDLARRPGFINCKIVE